MSTANAAGWFRLGQRLVNPDAISMVRLLQRRQPLSSPGPYEQTAFTHEEAAEVFIPGAEPFIVTGDELRILKENVPAC
jgi:hypothetical protein